MHSETSSQSDAEKAKRSPGIKLEVLSGPMDGTEFEIKKDVVNIGRDQDKEVSLPLDVIISRSHARISYENGKYWLEDLGSTNGTFIGEMNVKGKAKLPVGKIFRAGISEMRLVDKT
jgi:pSer/pThr/pTyr-binding forkhead associated (FHA) protein